MSDFKFITNDEFRRCVAEGLRGYMWVPGGPSEYRGNTWQVIGDKRRLESRRAAGFFINNFGIGPNLKYWVILCRCIDKNGKYHEKKIESISGLDEDIGSIWDREVNQWIHQHSGETFGPTSASGETQIQQGAATPPPATVEQSQDQNVASEKFRKVYADLEKALYPDDVTGKLFTLGLITQTERDSINGNGLDSTKKLLQAVEKAIFIDPKNLDIFRSVLESIGKYKPLAEKLK